MTKHLLPYFFLLTYFHTQGQSDLVDSLENELSIASQIDHSYIDKLNDLAFEWLRINPPKGIELIKKSILLADSLDYTKGRFRAHIHQGSAYWFSALYDEALRTYLFAYTIKPEDDLDGYIFLCNNIGEVFKKVHQYDSSAKYLKKARKMLLSSAEAQPTSMISYNIAELYYLNGLYDSASLYYDEAYDIALETPNAPRGLSYALFGQGDIAFQNDNLKLAINKHREALELRTRLKDRQATIQSHLRLGDYLLAMEHRNESKYHFEEAAALAREVNAFELLSQSLFGLSKYYENYGDYKQSLQFLQRAKTIDDSLEDVQFNSRINVMKAALEADIKESENRYLKAEQIKNEHAIDNQILLTTSIAIIGIILAALAYQYRRRMAIASDLADQVSITNEKLQGEVDRRTADLNETNNFLVQSQKMANLGNWEYDIKTGRRQWSEQMFTQMGLDPSDGEPDLDLIANFLGESNYQKMSDAIQQVIRTKEGLNLRFKIDSTDHKTKLLNVILDAKLDENGNVTKIHGYNQDITSALEEEEREKTKIESLLKLSYESNLARLPFDQFVEFVLEEVAIDLGIERVSFWFYHSDGPYIQCFRLFKLDTMTFDQGDQLFEKDFPEYFKGIRNERIIAADNAYKDERTSSFSESYLPTNDIYSMLDAQIRIGGNLLGVMCMEKTGEPKTWSLSDQRFATSLTDIIANAYTTEINLELKKMNSDLIHDLLSKNKRLEELNFLLYHNIRGPVSGTLGLLNLCSENQNPDFLNEALKHIRKYTEELDEIIKDLSQIMEVQNNGALDKQSVKLSALVSIALDRHSKDSGKSSYDINIEIPDNLVIEFSPELFQSMFDELLNNSIKFKADNRALEVTIKAQANHDEIEFLFSDNGKGFNITQSKEKIFQIYQRFQTEAEGRGFGLFYVKTLLELFNSKIEILKNQPFGITYSISFPQPRTKDTRLPIPSTGS